MTDDAIHQSGQGSAAERRIRLAPGQGSVARGHAAVIARVRSVGTSGLPVPRGSGPFGPAGRSFRGYGTDHAQASGGHDTSSPGVREEQRPDHRNDRDTRIGCVSGHSEKAWLSRAPSRAHLQSTLTMRLIACTIRSSPRLTVFLCPSGNVPSAPV